MRVPCPDARRVVAAQQPTQAQVSAHSMQEFDPARECRPARASDPFDAEPRPLVLRASSVVPWSLRAPLPGPAPGGMRVL